MQKHFTSHGNRCFQLRFTNGLVLSMNVGACGYNDNHNIHDFNAEHVETNTVECAVWIDDPEKGQEKNWITKMFFPEAEDGLCSVVGYVTMEEFQQTLPKIMGWRQQ